MEGNHVLSLRAEGYYHRFLLDNYSLLWPAFPAAFILALLYLPRPTVFCTIIFWVALIFLSLAGMNSWRYIYFIMPFFFSVYALAMAGLLHGVQRGISYVLSNSAETPSGRRADSFTPAVGAVLMVGVFVTNEALPRSFAMARGEHEATEKGDWSGVVPVLAPMITEDMLIATPRELQAFYHLGRADVTVSVSRLSELAEKVDFEIDPRTGLPTVGTADGAEHLIEYTGRGIFIVPSGVATWIRPIFPEPENCDGPATLTRVPDALPYGFDVISWDTPSIYASNCVDVPAQLLDAPEEG